MAPSGVAGPGGPVPDRDRTQLLTTERGFRGYRPLLNPAFSGLETAINMSGFIIRNGALTWDYGWTRYEDPAPVAVALPLGGNTTAFPGGTAGNPVVLLDYFPDHIHSGNEATIAVTADSAAGGNGDVFYYPHSGAAQWARLTDTSAAGGFNTDSTHVWDSCFYPYSYLTGGGALPRGTMLITNGVRDSANARVIIYPGTAANDYVTAATPTTGIDDLSSAGAFGCRSLASYAERVYAFNTLEGTNPNNRRNPQRLRWTRPGWTSYVSTIWARSTNLGAGYQDLLFAPGEGVAVRQIGRNLACYLSRGTVILRTTGQIRPAHSLVYSNSSRGLLGTKAVVDLGGGVHFGAFTDGFWFLTEDGQWNEAGIANEGGLRYRKFTDHFFAALYKPGAYRIQMGFDSDRRLVYITFPTGPSASNLWQTWVYDIDLDEMYPQVWEISGFSIEQDAYSYAFVDKGTTQSGRCLIHGTRSGHVWEHTPNTSTRDTQPLQYAYTTPYIAPSPFSMTTVNEAWMDLVNHNASNGISWTAQSGDGSSSSSLTVTPAASTRRIMQRIPLHVSGSSLYHTFTGNHPLTIHALGLKQQRTGEPPT